MADAEFLLLGDTLWLEFVNTAITLAEGADALPDPGAYLRWTKAVQVESPGDAAAFQGALELRAKLLALAVALDASRSAPPSGIEAINRLLTNLEGREQLVRIGGTWRLRFAPGRPPGALEAIALSAAQTLANPIARVRRCGSADCGLFFLDESPNHTRRWCSRARCGDRGRIERRRTTRITPVVADE